MTTHTLGLKRCASFAKLAGSAAHLRVRGRRGSYTDGREDEVSFLFLYSASMCVFDKWGIVWTKMEVLPCFLLRVTAKRQSCSFQQKRICNSVKNKHHNNILKVVKALLEYRAEAIWTASIYSRIHIHVKCHYAFHLLCFAKKENNMRYEWHDVNDDKISIIMYAITLSYLLMCFPLM